LTTSASLILIDPVSPKTGDMLEQVEFFVHDLRQKETSLLIGFHLTFWPLGVAYGEEWGIDFFLCHMPTFQQLHGFLPEGERGETIQGWRPPASWQLLAGSYRPTLAQVEKLNSFLHLAQTFRKKLNIQPSAGSHNLVRTVAPERTFLHFSVSDLQAYVADLRC
jgi:hypothetical protein